MSTPVPADRRPAKTRLFLSYGRADADELADSALSRGPRRSRTGL
ncbi:MAG: hypothetical protein ACLQIB_32960 [Isosphaeraceae bacterium]